MTKRKILTIIKENSVNRKIKWNVVENTKSLIVITNDYDFSIRFEITLNYKGNININEFSDSEEGIEIAIGTIVRLYEYYIMEG